MKMDELMTEIYKASALATATANAMDMAFSGGRKEAETAMGLVFLMEDVVGKLVVMAESVMAKR